jgi:hypothetical protein
MKATDHLSVEAQKLLAQSTTGIGRTSDTLALLGQSAVREFARHQTQTQLLRDLASSFSLKPQLDGLSGLTRGPAFEAAERLSSTMAKMELPSVRFAQQLQLGSATRLALQIADSPAIQAARHIAEQISRFRLPSALDGFRTGSEELSYKLLGLDSLKGLHVERGLGGIFASTSAFADAIALSTRVDSSLMAAAKAFALTELPCFDSLVQYRSFFDAAGLRLRRWPRIRPLSKAERKRRLREKRKRLAQPAHVTRAKRLIHQHERLLCDVIDEAMSDAFGDDWALHRLPLCDAKTLLGRAESKGGEPLDHADYHHYREIMMHPEHFEAVFALGFDDPDDIRQLIDKARDLRARSHHAARPFTPEDLRDLRLVWNAIIKALTALTPEFEIEWND